MGQGSGRLLGKCHYWSSSCMDRIAWKVRIAVEGRTAGSRE
jgi:hypothetical protein